MNVQPVFYNDTALVNWVKKGGEYKVNVFSDLAKQLKERGPLLAEGNFGPKTYKASPVPYKSSLSSNIYMWTKGSERRTEIQKNAVVVIGASQGLVFYKLDLSTEKKVYVTSFERFSSDVKSASALETQKLNIFDNKVNSYQPKKSHAAFKAYIFSCIGGEVLEYAKELALEVIKNPNRVQNLLGIFLAKPRQKVEEVSKTYKNAFAEGNHSDKKEDESYIKFIKLTSLEQKECHQLTGEAIEMLNKWYQETLSKCSNSMIFDTSMLIDLNPKEVLAKYKNDIVNREEATFQLSVHMSEKEVNDWVLKMSVDMNHFRLKEMGITEIRKHSEPLVSCFRYALGVLKPDKKSLTSSGWHKTAWPKEGDAVLYMNTLRNTFGHAAKYLGDGIAESKVGNYNPRIYRHRVFDMQLDYGDRVCFLTKDKSRALNK